jgi:peptidoglycan/LPS O-acetylase OafA/YrhL
MSDHAAAALAPHVGRAASGAEHLATLDGLRGVAALAIGALHAKQILVSFERFAHPYLAVDFFFCLSGFVIALAYERRLQGSMSLGEFAGRRILRLYPMILLGSALGGAVYFMGAMRDGGSPTQAVVLTVASLALLPAGLLYGKEGYPVNAPIWSLFFELLANLCYAALVPISNRALIGAAVVSAAALAIVAYYSDGVAKLGFLTPLSFAGGFVRVAYPFIAGVLIFRFAGLARWAVHPLVPVTAILLILGAPLPLSWWVDTALILAAIPLVVLVAVRAPAGKLSGLFYVLGAISYPFYLLHQPVLRVLKHVGPFNAFTGQHPLAAIAVATTVIAIASYPVFVLYDQRLREWFGATFFPPRTTAEVVASPTAAGTRSIGVSVQ